MKKLIILIIVFALTIGMAWLVPVFIRNPGLVQLEFMGYFIQMPLVVALLIGLSVFLSVWIIWYLLRLPGKAARNFKHNNSRRKFASGLLALSEGKWVSAEKLLVKSATRSPTPELSFMAAARAAMAQNDLAKAESYLDQAEKVIDNPLTVDLTRCELWIKAEQADKAMTLLQIILKSYPNNPRAVHLLTQAAQLNNNWEELRRILPKASKLKVINTQQQLLLTTHTLSEQMKTASNADELMAVWSDMTKTVRQQLFDGFAQNALRVGAYQELTDAIERHQKQEFSETMVSYWAQLPYNLNHRIKVAEKWLQSHTSSAVLLSCLGQLYIQKKQWDVAQSFLDQSLAIEPSAQVNQLLGQVYAAQKKPEKALQHFQQAAAPARSLMLKENINDSNSDE